MIGHDRALRSRCERLPPRRALHLQAGPIDRLPFQLNCRFLGPLASRTTAGMRTGPSQTAKSETVARLGSAKTVIPFFNLLCDWQKICRRKSAPKRCHSNGDLHLFQRQDLGSGAPYRAGSARLIRKQSRAQETRTRIPRVFFFMDAVSAPEFGLIRVRAAKMVRCFPPGPLH